MSTSVYDFESIVRTEDVAGGISYTFSDERLSGYQAIVVADTALSGSQGSRLTTMVVRFPRMVLAEFNTHRVFSRNSASSRARSMRVTIRDIMESPYIPLFTKNQKGMSGQFMSEDEAVKAKALWLEARDNAVALVIKMLLGERLPEKYQTNEQIVKDYESLVTYYQDEIYEKDDLALSPHKQNVNRLLEPFMFHEVVVTSSYWDNFFDLRADLSKSPQPEIFAVAVLIKKAMEDSTPTVRDYHLPFVAITDDNEPQSFDELVDLMMISSGEAAQVSYVDKTKKTGSATVDFGKRLMRMRHLSPAEHTAVAVESSWMKDKHGVSSNFSDGWVQLRGLYESGQIRI